MDIIVARLPKYLEPFCLALRKCGWPVYYLQAIRGQKETPDEVNGRVARLKDRGIVPLPIESLPHFTGFSEMNSDPGKKTLERTRQIAPDALLNSFRKFFPGSPDVPGKLRIAVHSIVAVQTMTVAGRVNIYARENPDRKYLLIDVSPQGYLTPELVPNVRLLVLPLDIVAGGVRGVFSLVARSLSLLRARIAGRNDRAIPASGPDHDLSGHRVAFVTHQGLRYGNLFEKDLFLSEQEDSPLNRKKMLYLDYSDWPSPSEELAWIRLRETNRSQISIISSGLSAIAAGFFHIRHLREFTGLILLAGFYASYRAFSRSLAAFPNLNTALIDYDVLCPKPLLMAFEGRKIRTVAAQERFILTFNNLIGSTILDRYLCASGYAADIMKRSSLYSVDRYVPVGQYRSDNLLKAGNEEPPGILKDPIEKGLRIITALGFHTVPDWHTSQTHPLVSWNAHRQFLCDMIRLSREIPDVFIVLRFKNVDWVSLPVFSDIVGTIKDSGNIAISMDYDKPFASYDLCAHADLVVAKHTSLADECLSAGIPVLFHEYTHNTERIIADEFDYRPTKIMCFSYQELAERAKSILDGDSVPMKKDFQYLEEVVYGCFGDGNARKRIHEQIDRLLGENERDDRVPGGPGRDI